MIGFLGLPVLFLKPNALSPSGAELNLLELQGDFRYLFLFALSFAPFLAAGMKDLTNRGWMLVLIGNGMMILTLWLPAIASEELLANAADFISNPTNPRSQPAAAIVTGLAGGYSVLFGGLDDLKQTDVSNTSRRLGAWGGMIIILVMLLAGSFDAYSVMLEFSINGESLGLETLRHVTYVLVALTTGLVIGVGLGLWAHSDDNAAPILLYAVGIIQTIPSLALFGVLLVPLANLGDADVSSIVLVILGLAALTSVLLFALFRGRNRYPEIVQRVLTIVGAVLAAIPISLVALLLLSFLYRIAFNAMEGGLYTTSKSVLTLTFAAMLLMVVLPRLIRIREQQRRIFRRARLVAVILFLLSLVALLTQSAIDFLPEKSFDDYILNDIGIRGIGVTPSLVALTLYSLLPVVRNTYVGLQNVDNEIIDSARGMGMTPTQIFFQIELPLAFPVIMAGVRNAAIALVGIAAIATVIGGGGLGEFILNGINDVSVDKILLGTIPAILLAFVLDAVLEITEDFLTSPGLKYV